MTPYNLFIQKLLLADKLSSVYNIDVIGTLLIQKIRYSDMELLPMF